MPVTVKVTGRELLIKVNIFGDPGKLFESCHSRPHRELRFSIISLNTVPIVAGRFRGNDRMNI